MRKLGYKIELRTERMYNEGFIIVTIIGEQIKVEGVLTEDYITSEENGDLITIIIHEYDVDIMGFNYELKFSINREQFQLPYEFYGEFEKDDDKDDMFLKLKTIQKINNLSHYERLLERFKKEKNIIF